MHKEILSAEQQELLPLLKMFKRDFCLVGGTAIALYIGHRRSLDFDLFKKNTINHTRIIQKINVFTNEFIVTRRVAEQLNLVIKDVKFTFYEFPFDIHGSYEFEKTIKMPDLLTLSAMKAYALGRRSKWKDYIDLYFILKDCFTIEQISFRALTLFGQLFSEKLFRAQLCYFKDIDYSEEIDFLEGFKVSEKRVKEFLITKALVI